MIQIEDRFALILKSLLASRSEKLERQFWEQLETATAVPSASWQTANRRRQRPTLPMLAGIARLYPEYAFWLMTGITDSANGHVAPMTALTFPERPAQSQPLAKQYFMKSLSLCDSLFENAGIDYTDQKQRMYAVERTKPLDDWIASNFLDNVYQAAKTAPYKAIARLAKKRQQWNQEPSPEKPLVASNPLADRRAAHQTDRERFYRPASSD